MTGLAILLLVLLAACAPEGRQQFQLGEQLLREGRPAEAIAPLREAVRAFATNAPASAQAWNYLGLAYHQSGQPEQAALAYKAALEKDMNLFAARYNRGVLLSEQGNLPAAINELTTYTTHVPNDAAGWLMLGKAQFRAGLYDAADRNLQQCRRLSTTPLQQAEALNALGMSQAARRRAREAFTYFEAALNCVSNFPPALLNEAVLSQQLKDWPFALQKYRAYLEVAGDAPNAAAIRALTNQLAAAAKPAAPATNPPPLLTIASNRPPATSNLTTTIRTSPPPAVVKTSPPPAVARTSAPPAEIAVRTPPATNVARADQPPPAAAPERPAVSNPPPAVVSVPPEKKPEPEPEPKLEVVKLEEEPELRPAGDLKPATTTTPPVTVASKPTLPATPSAATNAPAKSEVPTESEPAPKKKSFFAKLNPLGWFGSKDKEQPPEKPEAPPKEKSKPPKPVATKPTADKPPETKRVAAAPVRPVAPAPAPETAPAPTFPRYKYLQLPAPVAGNRAEADRLVAEGVQAHRAGRPAEAMSDYAEAVKADPACFNAQFNLAVAAYDISDWSRSLAAYEKALAISSEDSRARYGFALALERAGYPVDAAKELEQLLTRDPANVDAHLALASLYANTLGDRTKAREHYLKVLQLAPAHPQAPQIKRWLGPIRQ